jgi:hypothetical protein
MSSPRVRIYWRLLGGHVHVRVFCNGKAGDLVFSEDEWKAVESSLRSAGFTVLHEDESEAT